MYKSILLFGVGILGCFATWAAEKSPEPADLFTYQIAFMPDVHFHDVYADFRDGNYPGIPNPNGHNATIRSLQAELNSTRLFNENYFALLAALDDLASQNIKLVALPGDFTDDGQPVHVRGLAKILRRYTQQYGMRFFATNGNHDPVRPFDFAGGKRDFLAADGSEQAVFSPDSEPCKAHQADVICTDDIKHWGYTGIINQMADFGFYPLKQDIYWETPYSNYSQAYSFEQAKQQSALSQRQFDICVDAKAKVQKTCSQMTDSSYLVEPVPGLWLLAVDANVYVPKIIGAAKGNEFNGSGNAGYNQMLKHKQHVINWIADVAKRARLQHKTLVTFSHFPMYEFYDGQSQAIAGLFGQNQFQLKRKPDSEVSRKLANTGIRLHVAGHMHFNDTGVAHGDDGQVLFNIQAPSIAAYVPAYKLLSFKSADEVLVQTKVVDSVPRFNALFAFYQQEYSYRQHNGLPLWNKAILASQHYDEFANWHIRELTRQRFLPNEWPQTLRQLLLQLSGDKMLLLLTMQAQTSLQNLLENNNALTELLQSDDAQQASQQLADKLSQYQLTLADFSGWNGLDLAVDFYRVRNAGQLAKRNVSAKRFAQYRVLTELAAGIKSDQQSLTMQTPVAQIFARQFAAMMAIFDGLANGYPDVDFELNLAKGTIQALE
ncbi:metallophosphoesterase [Neptunicella marina]|uniref:Metallophosphoesterase n=1 Tax=Neptunicella marina TaxID=2125989 RepID=A0A8J6IUS2_9ALTE|nr:metallophosphoesterase [Neptunicella marina]MBC3766152.1 metallophosphoesterase [Neptunicella marina]